MGEIKLPLKETDESVKAAYSIKRNFCRLYCYMIAYAYNINLRIRSKYK
jgi:hypothetical protein